MYNNFQNHEVSNRGFYNYQQNQKEVRDIKIQVEKRQSFHESYPTKITTSQQQLTNLISKAIQFNSPHFNSQELLQLLDQFANEKMQLTKLQALQRQNSQRFQYEIKELSQQSQKLKSVKINGQNNGHNSTRKFSTQNETQAEIEALRSMLKQIEGLIQEKNNFQGGKTDFQKYQEEFDDFSKLQAKLKDQLSLKESQQILEKQKIILQHEKLTKLQKQDAQKEQTLLSLVKHYEQIKQRVMALKKQKKQLVNNQKRKNQPVKYPVREQISIYERQNKLLEKQLENEKNKLREYQEIKNNSVHAEIFTERKQKLEQLKISEISLKQKIAENKILKEQQRQLSQSLKTLKDIQLIGIKGQKQKIEKFKKQIQEYQKQKYNLECIIQDSHCKIVDYIQKFSNRGQQSSQQPSGLIYHQQANQQQINNNFQGKTKKKHKQRIITKIDDKQVKDKQQKEINQGWLQSLKQDIKVSFNDWMVNLQMSGVSLPKVAVFMASVIIIVFFLISI